MQLQINREDEPVEVKQIRLRVGDAIYRLETHTFAPGILVVTKTDFSDKGEDAINMKPVMSNQIELK